MTKPIQYKLMFMIAKLQKNIETAVQVSLYRQVILNRYCLEYMK